MTSLADKLCLGGLKAGVSTIKSSSQQLIPEERTAVLFPPASDPSMTLALLGYVSALDLIMVSQGLGSLIGQPVTWPLLSLGRKAAFFFFFFFF